MAITKYIYTEEINDLYCNYLKPWKLYKVLQKTKDGFGNNLFTVIDETGDEVCVKVNCSIKDRHTNSFWWPWKAK